MCGVLHERFIVRTQPTVWGPLLAGGLLGERQAARTCRRFMLPFRCMPAHPAPNPCGRL